MSLNGTIWDTFALHYDKRLNGTTAGERTQPIPFSEVDQSAELPGVYYDHPKLRPGNGPRIFYHGHKTEDVIVLTHGFTDSPFYLQEVAACFFREGCNVLLPLLPAHGLKDPSKAILEQDLDIKWREMIDASVDVAHLLGERVSIGGFSTGGALSLNKIVRHRADIQGGLFLFSAALSLGKVLDAIGHSKVVDWLAGVFLDRMAVTGDGPNPYKYPVLPNAVASEVVEIIRENNEKVEEVAPLTQAVFAAHSHHDTTAEIDGVIDFLAQYVPSDRQLFYPIHDKVTHSSLPLRNNIALKLDLIGQHEKDPEKIKKEQQEWLNKVAANPHFDDMMSQAIGFFREKVCE